MAFEQKESKKQTLYWDSKMRFNMDNFSIDVTGRNTGYDSSGNALEDLTKFILGDDKIQLYAIRDKQEGERPQFDDDWPRPKRLVFYHYSSDTVEKSLIKHPFPMDYAAVANFCSEWLKTIPNDEYEGWIDLDGSLAPGWRVWNEDWGHIDNHWGAAFAISPHWGWIGK